LPLVIGERFFCAADWAPGSLVLWLAASVLGYAYVSAISCDRPNPFASRDGGYDFAKLTLAAAVAYWPAGANALFGPCLGMRQRAGMCPLAFGASGVCVCVCVCVYLSRCRELVQQHRVVELLRGWTSVYALRCTGAAGSSLPGAGQLRRRSGPLMMSLAVMGRRVWCSHRRGSKTLRGLIGL
jgi:hypothetical protein